MPELSAIAELSWLARGRALASKGLPGEAGEWLAANRAPERVQRVFKSAIGAGMSTSTTQGDVAIGALSDAMRTASAFYRILGDNGFTRVPMQKRIGIVTSSPSAGVVAEGASIGVSKIVLDNVTLMPIKVAALMVVTDELLFDVSSPGQACFSRELQGVVAAAVDTAFVDIIDNGTTPITSTSPNKDLRAALLAVNSAGIARPYWLAAEDVAKFASTLSNAAAGPAFAAASATGGELANLPMLVSSGIPAGTLYLVDAAGIAADGAEATVEASGNADVYMDTAPPMNATTPTPSGSMVSMFQTNSIAVKAVATIGAAKLRSNAVAVVTSITGTTWST